MSESKFIVHKEYTETTASYVTDNYKADMRIQRKEAAKVDNLSITITDKEGKFLGTVSAIRNEKDELLFNYHSFPQSLMPDIFKVVEEVNKEVENMIGNNKE